MEITPQQEFYQRKIQECLEKSCLEFKLGNLDVGRYYDKEANNYRELLKMYLNR